MRKELEVTYRKFYCKKLQRRQDAEISLQNYCKNRCKVLFSLLLLYGNCYKKAKSIKKNDRFNFYRPNVKIQLLIK